MIGGGAAQVSLISVTIYVSLCGCSWGCCVNLGSNAAVDDGDDDMREY